MPSKPVSYLEFKRTLFQDFTEQELLYVLEIDSFMLISRFEDLVKAKYDELGGAKREGN